MSLTHTQLAEMVGTLIADIARDEAIKLLGVEESDRRYLSNKHLPMDVIIRQLGLPEVTVQKLLAIYWRTVSLPAVPMDDHQSDVARTTAMLKRLFPEY